jgi:CBS domain-containing protein
VTTVSRILEGKGNDIWSVGPDDSVYDAIKLMAERQVGALLVMENQKLVGIVSERDYARKVILKGRASQETPVREIMTERVVYVRPEQSVEDSMALMTAKKIRHLPVMDESQVIGIVSIRDLVKSVLSEKQFLIDHLENYITGR